MKNATSVFVVEHTIIEQVLNCLEIIARRCETDHLLESELAREVVRFFRGFAEQFHCDQEASQLLPTMEALGISPEQCLDCSVHRRRSEGSRHLDAMERVIEPASVGQTVALDEFAHHARAYVALVMDYIAQQEDCLFPCLLNAASESDHTNLAAKGNETFRDDCVWNAYTDLAGQIAIRMNLQRAAEVIRAAREQ